MTGLLKSSVGRTVFGFALASILAACAQTDVDTASEDIIGGTPAKDDPAVFAILQSSETSKSLCSGTLVSPHVVLTAAHCFVPAIDGAKRVNWIIKGDDADSPWPWNWSSTATANIHPHPAYSHYLSGYDIAVVVLESAQSAAPVPLHREALTDADIGSSLRFVGFGRTNAEDPDSSNEKNQVSLRLVSVDADRFACEAPEGQPEANTCRGDSGGPGFLLKNGVEYVAGVTSYGDKNCAGAGTSTRVDHFTPFVDPYIVKYDPAYAAERGITAPVP